MSCHQIVLLQLFKANEKRTKEDLVGEWWIYAAWTPVIPLGTAGMKVLKRHKKIERNDLHPREQYIQGIVHSTVLVKVAM